MELRLGDRHLVHDLNLVVVADMLRRHQPISRVEVAERTNLGRSTVSGIITALLDRGLVREIGSAKSTGGRKAILLELAADSRLIAVVRLAPRTVTLGLANLQGNLLVRQRRGLRGPTEPEQLLGQLLIWLDELCQEHGGGRPLVGVGLAIPGIVDGRSGRVLRSQLLGWEQVSVAGRIEAQMGVPVLLENDANAFALGEAVQSGEGGSLVGISLGADIAAGIVLDGRIYRGAGNAAGAFAHAVLDPAGPPCACGRRGCLAAYASDSALAAAAVARLQAGERSLVADLVDFDLSAVTRETLVAAASDGDPLARELLQGAGERIGAALAHLCATLAPALLVVDGESADRSGELLLAPLRRTLRERLPLWLAELPVRVAASGETNLIGAAAMVIEKIFQPPLHRASEADRRLSIATWI